MTATAEVKKSVHLSAMRAHGRVRPGMRAVPVRRVRGKFDSAATNEDNRRHWANADGLSADSAASVDVRRTLRNRSRYEVANNSYARGIVLTLANDVVGTGPRLQMLLGDGADGTVNQAIEREFAAWARAVDLAGKLRTMRMAKSVDGEGFAVLTANPMIDSPVMLDVQLVEADRYLNSRDACRRKNRGLNLAKLSPPGAS